MYNITKNIEKDESNYDIKVKNIIEDIVQKKNVKIKKENLIFSLWYNSFIKGVNGKDKNFNISDDCISCKICLKVCPVNKYRDKKL